MENAFQYDALFVRWVKGEISDAERQVFEQHPDFAVYKPMLESAKGQQLSESELQDLWGKVTDSKLQNKNKSRKQAWLWWAIAAASIVTLALFAWTVLKPMPSIPSISATTTGEKKTVELPDGSEVSLNAVSSLEVFNNNWSAERRVRLIGEAFFQVKKGGSPFIVENSAGSVSVLGTSFNIRYRGSAFEVECYEGWVTASTQKGNKQALRAGQKAVARNGNWLPMDALTDSWPSWMEGESYFSDVPVYEIFAELKRQYGIDISASGIEGRRFSGTFSHGDLPRALRMVCEPLGLQYELEGKEVLIRRKQ